MGSNRFDICRSSVLTLMRCAVAQGDPSNLVMDLSLKTGSKLLSFHLFLLFFETCILLSLLKFKVISNNFQIMFKVISVS